LDEDSLDWDLVCGLESKGIDVLTAASASRLGLPDEEQLTFAAGQGRVLYTRNLKDFARLHARWLQAGKHHAGIIVLVRQMAPIGVQVRALSRMAEAMSSEVMRDRLEFLGSRWMR
jgi:hypothetical protein